MSTFADDLLGWYDAHARDLPWRGPAVPAWHTWLSEIMLQQTRVQTVIPYFERFTERFPTLADLAAADLDEVLAMWSGLGYYSRARNLHRAAQMAAEQASFPATIPALKALPGVGDYVSAAVGSIAFGLPEPAIDGNLERVLSRVHAHPGGRKAVLPFGRALISADRPGDWNQAMMDLGSRICRPKQADCGACPVRAHCAGFAAGTPTAWPEPRKRKKAPQRAAVATAIWRDGRLLLARRPPRGLFGGLYELPGGLLEEASPPGPAAVALLAEKLGLAVTVERRLGAVQHTLTHMRLQVEVLEASAVGEPEPSGYTAVVWADPDDADALDGLGLSTLARKVLAVVRGAQQSLL